MSIAKFAVPSNWKQTSLKHIAKIKSGSTPLRAQHERYFIDGQIPWIKTMDLTNEKIFQTDECITELAIQETSCPILQPGTVLVAMYGGFNQIGRTGIMTFAGSINQAISSLTVDEASVIPDYVLYWLNANIGLWRRFAASSRKDPNITKKDVEDFPILLPPLPEQRKIAEILSTWDEAIAASQRLLSVLRERKKGLMQRLLSGQVRFEGFARSTSYVDTHYGKFPEDWTVESAKNLFYIKGRIGWKGLKKSEFIDSGPYLITGMHFNDHGGIDWDKCFHVSQERYLESPEIMVREKDILITKDGTIGKIAFISFLPGEASLNSHLLLVRPKTLDIDPLFSYYLFGSGIFENFIDRNKSGSTLTGLPQGVFEKFPVHYPSIAEQKVISNVLASCDDEIIMTERKLEALQAQKKGLMQRLLTGEVRVKI